MSKWFKFFCPSEELQLKGTLNGGQSFRWTNVLKNEEETWIGIISSNVFFLKQSETHINYKVFGNLSTNEKQCNTILHNYFQLDLNLKKNFEVWSNKDPIFKKAAAGFYGIRILKQDLVENIFSFICSSNNNIKRITSMVEKLATIYGEKIIQVDEKPYYEFPKVEKLAEKEVEERLKKEGFGYRAKYIHQTAKQIIANGGDEWLAKVRSLEYKEARNHLMELSGIGPKVADCICLMSLGHLGTIPVDTHVYQIARNFYLPQLRKQKTVTANVYQQIGDHFRKLYGEHAGWAHTVLFCADLKKFQN